MTTASRLQQRCATGAGRASSGGWSGRWCGRTFATRYHGTIGGFVWALLKPLTMFLVLMGVFSFVFSNTPQYRLGLILGLFLYEFFQEGTRTGLESLRAKGYLLTKARFPSWVVVVTSISNAVITLTLFSVVLMTFLIVSGRAPAPVGDRAVRLVSAALLRDRRRVLARRRACCSCVPRPQSGLGGGDARRLLRRADHLSDRRAARAAAHLPVSLAADANHPVRAERADRGQGAERAWRTGC